MLTRQPDKEREALGFQEAVVSSFKFLEDLGFQILENEVTLVRYESANVFVNVYHGRSSFELGIEVGTLDAPDERLYIEDIVAWAGGENAEGFGQRTMFQVSSRSGVQEFVPKLASLLEKYGMSLVHGEKRSFVAAKRVQSSRAKQLARQFRLKQVRAQAEEAWHAKNYTGLIELYQSIREDLNELELKRIAYSEQQLLPSVKVGATKKE